MRFCPQTFQRVAHCITYGFGLAVMAILLVASFEFVSSEIDMFGSRGWLAVIFPLFFFFKLFSLPERLP